MIPVMYFCKVLNFPCDYREYNTSFPYLLIKNESYFYEEIKAHSYQSYVNRC